MKKVASLYWTKLSQLLQDYRFLNIDISLNLQFSVPVFTFIQNLSSCCCFHLILLITHISCLTQLSEILKFGVDKLLSSEESTVQDVKLEKILGLSHDGQWVDDEDSTSLREEEEEEEETSSENDGQSMFYHPVI